MRQHDGLDNLRNPVGLDDTASTPDLPDRSVVNRPLVFLVCGFDNIDALNVSCQGGSVDGDTKGFDKRGLVGNVELLRLETAVNSLVESLALATESRRDAEVVGARESGSGDVKVHSFHLRPDSGAFLACDVLDDLVKNIG